MWLTQEIEWSGKYRQWNDLMMSFHIKQVLRLIINSLAYVYPHMFACAPFRTNRLINLDSAISTIPTGIQEIYTPIEWRGKLSNDLGQKVCFLPYLALGIGD